MDKLREFLSKYETHSRPFTHISSRNPAAKFNIPEEETKKFFKLYNNAVAKKEDLYLTECNLSEVSPIKIDIDIKFDYSSDKPHYYTMTHIMRFIKYYFRKMRQFLKIDKDVIIVITEKDKYTTAKNGTYKDGFHIMFPEIVTEFALQHYIRHMMIEQDIVTKVFGDLNPINSQEDIFDKSVIHTNNWALYGSKGKPENGQVYKVTSILQLSNKKELEAAECTVEDLKIKNLSKYLSIRIREISTQYFNGAIETVINNWWNQQHPPRQPRQNKQEPVQDLATVKKLIKILDPSRADDYHTWIQVGWCLFNTDSSLYDEFEEFSKQCPSKFDPEACEKVWDTASEGLTVASLFYWAKHDNPEEYQKLMRESVHTKIEEFKKGHVDLARIAYMMYKHEFVYVHSLNRNKNGWYQFKDHRWYFQPDGFVLRRHLTDDLRILYEDLNDKYKKMYYETQQENEKKVFDANIKDTIFIASKLSNNDFVKKVMEECTYIFRDTLFLEKLDRNPYLIGFKNGVYDLENSIFRDGVPNDYISKSTNINYIPIDKTDQQTKKEITRFLKEILPNQAVRDYMILVMASSLDYVNREEKFYITIGAGRNGKSLLMHLHQESLGDYTCALPVSLITQKRTESGKATPELVKMDLKRFCLIKEPDTSNISLNVGIIKELTGNDLVSCRNLHENDNEFRVSSKLLLMTNYLPDVYSDDAAIWDRIRVIEFPIHFCEASEIKNPNDKLIDKNLKNKLKYWKETYVSLLIEFYKKYAANGINEPEEVMQATKLYRERNNILLEFVSDKLEEGTTRSKITVSQLYLMYTSWHQEWYSNKKQTPKKEFDGYLRTHFGSKYKDNEIRGYKVKVVEEDSSDTDKQTKNDDDILES